jgi:hypothetical protein
MIESLGKVTNERPGPEQHHADYRQITFALGAA